MVGLLVIELLEESGGEGCVFFNQGVEFMMGGCGGVDGWVRVAGHSSPVEDTEGVPAEGGMGLAVFEGGLFLWLATFRLLLGGWWFKGVAAEVPRWWG